MGSPVALSVLDPENSYRNLALVGRVVEVISEERGAAVGINRLAKKYLGVEEYRIAPRESDECSSGCGPRWSAAGAKTSLSGFAGNSGDTILNETRRWSLQRSKRRSVQEATSVKNCP